MSVIAAEAGASRRGAAVRVHAAAVVPRSFLRRVAKAGRCGGTGGSRRGVGRGPVNPTVLERVTLELAFARLANRSRRDGHNHDDGYEGDESEDDA